MQSALPPDQPSVDRLNEEGEIMPAPRGYREAIVTMHVDDYSVESRIHAYLPDPARYWNGWACPIFPADTFVKERAAWQLLFPTIDSEDITIKWTVTGRLSVVMHYDGEADEDDVDTFVIDGVEYVSCGAYGMVWEEVTDV
jgi:hypothetical protein